MGKGSKHLLCLSAWWQGSLGPFTGCSQSPDGPLVGCDVFLVFPLELSDEMVHHADVKVFPSQVSVTRSGFDFKDALLDCQNRHIKGSPAQVKDQHVPFSSNLSRNKNNFLFTVKYENMMIPNQHQGIATCRIDKISFWFNQWMILHYKT